MQNTPWFRPIWNPGFDGAKNPVTHLSLSFTRYTGREGGREDPFFTPRSPFFFFFPFFLHFLLSHHRSATIDYCRICIQDAVCSTTSDSSHLPLLDILFLTLKMMKISRRETSNQLIFGDSFLRKIRKITFFQRQRLFGLIIFERKIGREDVYDYIPWCYLIPKINPFVHARTWWKQRWGKDLEDEHDPREESSLRFRLLFYEFFLDCRSCMYRRICFSSTFRTSQARRNFRIQPTLPIQVCNDKLILLLMHNRLENRGDSSKISRSFRAVSINF